MNKLLKFAIGGLPPLMYDHTKNSKSIIESSNEITLRNEIDHITDIIEKSRLDGLNELTINISSDLKDELKSGLSIPQSSGLPATFEIKSETAKNGNYQLHIKLSEQGEITKTLTELTKLHKSGSLTDNEFQTAKQKVLNRL